MKTVLHQAKLKNKLLNKYLKGQLETTKEIIAEVLVEDGKVHPDYTPEKIFKGQGVKKWHDGLSSWARNTVNLFTNAQFITLQLDKGITAGVWSQMIFHPLKGIGKFAGVFGQTALNTLTASVKTEFDKHVKIYGKNEFKNLGVTRVNVPEFKDIPGLQKGEITKLDLVMMLAHIKSQGRVYIRPYPDFFITYPNFFLIILQMIYSNQTKHAFTE